MSMCKNLSSFRPPQENNTRLARHPGAKSFLPKPEVRPRAALGSIGNNVLEKQQPGKAKVSDVTDFVLIHQDVPIPSNSRCPKVL